MIHELGEVLAAAERFPLAPQLTIADVDLQRLRLERLRTPTFNDAAAFAGHPEETFRRVTFEHRPSFADVGLKRTLQRFPYVPSARERLDLDCYEAFNIQVSGLAKRLQSTGAKHMVIGISGGLDSTHALLVAAKVCDRLGLPRSTILGYTMPGFATGEETKANAWALMRALGVEAAEIDIRPAARQMLADMGHPFANGEPVYDVTFENVQAGLRTDYLFRLANHHNGFVVGTGDLSELALGWCTYGVGDHMSHYAVNAGVPKTLIQYLIRWTVKTGQFEPQAARPCLRSSRPRSRRSWCRPAPMARCRAPNRRSGPTNSTISSCSMCCAQGLPPAKIAFLAWHAWRDLDAGAWPFDFPADARKRLRPRDHPQVARGVPVPLLPDQPVQALGDPERAEGVSRRQPVAAR